MTNWNIRLAQADRAICKAEQLIVKQEALITRLDGDHKAEAAEILKLMKNTLADFSRHRELLRRAVAATTPSEGVPFAPSPFRTNPKARA